METRMEGEEKHQLEVLSSANACAIFRCDCGTYHIQIKSMSMKMNASEFRQLRDCVVMAGIVLPQESSN